MDKQCTKCKEVKYFTGFSLNKKTTDGLQSWCKECVAENSRKYYKARPNKVFEQNIERYGINIDQYNSMLNDQGGKCAICGIIPIGKKKLGVDHCHETDKVRGLLCSNCNLGISMFGDKPDVMLSAARYLGGR